MNIFLFALFSTEQAHAHYPRRNPNASGVALGVSTGPVINLSDKHSEISFSGGFYTDIPLIDTFHITPSTTIYRYKDLSKTDISLSFKFLIPLNNLQLMGGISAGLTSTNNLYPHVGIFAGSSFHVVSNLGWFVNVNYLHQFDDPVVHNVSVTTGPLFRFSR